MVSVFITITNFTSVIYDPQAIAQNILSTILSCWLLYYEYEGTKDTKSCTHTIGQPR